MQEDFCRAIVAGLTNQQAYIKAGYSGKAALLHAPASRLLHSKPIAARIAELREPALRTSQVTAERIIAELAKVAFFDIGNLFYADGKMRPMAELAEEVRRGLKLEKGRISTHDKLAALDSLAKILGMFKSSEPPAPPENVANNTLIIMDLRNTRLVDGQIVPIKAIEAPQ